MSTDVVIPTNSDATNTTNNNNNNEEEEDEAVRRQREREEEMERLLIEQDEEINFGGSSHHSSPNRQRNNNNNDNEQPEQQQQQQLPGQRQQPPRQPELDEEFFDHLFGRRQEHDDDNNDDNNNVIIAGRNRLVDTDNVVQNDNIGIRLGDNGQLVVQNDNDDNNNERDGRVVALDNNDNDNVEVAPVDAAMAGQRVHQPVTPKYRSTIFSYRPMSFLALFVLLYYAFRTRRQYYLAVVYLCSSKYAIIIMGNAVIASAVSVFDSAVKLFLNGLRIQEAEGLNDFFRWNITETCLALTMFRSELSIGTAIEFVVIVTMKCLHHVTMMREQHLRMTQECVYENPNRPGTMTFRTQHIKLLSFLVVLQFVDLVIIQHTAYLIQKHGASVSLLFAFEAAIMLISSWSHILLWNIHFIDSLLVYGHEKRADEQAAGKTKHGLFVTICYNLFHRWKEYKPMFQFAVQLQSQAIQFILYAAFFIAVLTFYGIPINLFREVYMSFIAFKERLVAFLKYRQLMASMNRFDNVSDDAELDEAGKICIICRDEMTIHDCKKLPGCAHIFHKSCLREWLVQQQSCPTCRADISANETIERTRRLALNAAANRRVLQVHDVAVAVFAGAIPPQQPAAAVAGQRQDEVTAPEQQQQDEPIRRDDERHGQNSEQQQPAQPTLIGSIEDENNTTTASTEVPVVSSEPKRRSRYVISYNDDNDDDDDAFARSFLDKTDVTALLRDNTEQTVSEKQSAFGGIGGISSSIHTQTILPETIKESMIFLEWLDERKNRTRNNTTNNNNKNKNTSRTTSFPALYQIIDTNGTNVYKSFESSDVDNATTNIVVRTVEHKTIVLGQGIIQTSLSDPSYIKIPDGYVLESSVTRFATIYQQKPSKNE